MTTAPEPGRMVSAPADLPYLPCIVGRHWRPVADMRVTLARLPRYRWHLAPNEKMVLFHACANGRAQTAMTRRNGRIVMLARLTAKALQ